MRSALLLSASILLVACGSSSPAASPAAVPSSPASASAAAPAQRAVPPVAGARDVEGVKERIKALVTANDGQGLFDLFAAKMQAAVPLDKAKALTDQVHGSVGPWKTESREGDTSSSDHGVWRVEGERGALRLEIHLDADRKIDGLLFRPAS
jgi:hypothetical protein